MTHLIYWLRFRSAWLSLFFLFFALEVLRSPEIFFVGRFFAEEGSLYWAHALSSSFGDHVTFVAPIANYLLLNCNLQTWIAAMVPISIGPLVTAWTSLAFMAVPSLLVMVADNRRLDFKLRFSIAAALLFGRPVLSTEILANSINTQVFLGLATVCILVFGYAASKPARFATQAIVVIAAFSGWYSCVLFPFFVYRGVRLKSRTYLCSSAFLLAGLITQSLIFLELRFGSSSTSHRLSHPLSLASVVADLANVISHAVSPLESRFVSPLFLLVAVTFVGVYIYRRFRPRPGSVLILRADGGALNAVSAKFDQEMAYLMGCFTVEFCLVVIGRAQESFAGRYAAIPSSVALMLIILAAFSIKNPSSVLRYCKRTIIGVVTLSSLCTIIFPTNVEYLRAPDGFSWSEQLAKLDGKQDATVFHWPIASAGEQDWQTNMSKPSPRLAPFQESLTK